MADAKNLSESHPLLRSYMPELDSIRGIAILATLWYHLLFWARDLSLYPRWQARILAIASLGQFGVHLFFVLSGFLITGILLDSRERRDYYLRFYQHRAVRILPAYYLTLAAITAFGVTSTGFLVMSLFYCSNLSPLFGIALSYPVLWSLAVEEHFYLIWPTVVRFLSISTLLKVLLLLFCISPIIRLFSYFHAVKTNTFYSGFGYFTWNNLDGLALGGILALLLRYKDFTRRHARWLAFILFLGAAVVTLAGFRYGIFTRMTAVGTACQIVPFNLSFGGLLLTFLLLGSANSSRLVSPLFLTFFGRISYGLYLYHLLVISGYDAIEKRTHWAVRVGFGLWGQVWVRFVLVSLAAVFVSYLSRRYFEEPLLKLKDRPIRLWRA